MRSSIKKLLSLVLCMLLIVAVFSGCGQSKKSDNSTVQEQKESKSSEQTQSKGPESLSLPIVKDKITLTMFTELDAKVSATLKNMGEMLAFEELEKRTGIHIEFLHPPAGQEKEQFNLMLASQDLPDLVHYGWASIPGGPEKAIEDGAIIQLNDLIADYAPNLNKLFEDVPVVKKDVATDTGKLYMFPFVRVDKLSRLSDGFQIRKDWLNKVGLKEPTTIEEWYTVLKAFKENDLNGNGKADEIPFISLGIGKSTTNRSLINFLGAWGIAYDFYQDNGKVKYGPAQSEYKEFLTTMRKWYQEGLIDADFISTDNKNFEAKVTSQVAGAYHGLLNGNMGKFTGLMQEKDPNFLISQVPFLTAPDGKSYNFAIMAGRMAPGNGTVITSKNKYPKESAKWLDYLYSEDGIKLLSFGIEGVTYKMENGVPKYTDLITKNPDGLSLVNALCKYTPASVSPRLYQDPGYWDQMMMYDNQREALKIQSTASTEKVLPLLYPTTDEATQLANIMNEVNTYVDEMAAKFIMGIEPIENFDKYISTLKSMGIEEALTIQQAALDRYQKRGQ